MEDRVTSEAEQMMEAHTSKMFDTSALNDASPTLPLGISAPQKREVSGAIEAATFTGKAD